MADDLVEHLFVQHGRNLVDRIGIETLDHRLALHIAEKADLRLLVFRNMAIRAAQQNIGLDTDFAQFLDGMLRRLGLQFTGRRNVGQQGEVHVTSVTAPFLQAHLTDRFKERQRLDVADGTADFDDGHIGAFRTAPDMRLDLVGNVRDNLNGLAKILAAPLLLDHRLVNLTGSEVVALAHPGAGKALVMP